MRKASMMVMVECPTCEGNMRPGRKECEQCAYDRDALKAQAILNGWRNPETEPHEDIRKRARAITESIFDSWPDVDKREEPSD